MINKIEKKAQIWIETLIYTLIGLALISLVLAFLLPKTKEKTDEIIIKQTISDINDIDSAILSVTYAEGNVRTREFSIRKGQLVFDCKNDIILFEMENSNKEYSEPGTITVGGSNLKILTTKANDLYNVKTWMNYSGYLNISCDRQKIEKSFQKASAPYKISIENTGFNRALNVTNINIVEIS